MLTPVLLTSDTDSLTAHALVFGGMLFLTDETTLSCHLCDRTIRDYGLMPEQFKLMIARDGLRQMIDYYPDAFLCVGQNRYIHCEIVEETIQANETEFV